MLTRLGRRGLLAIYALLILVPLAVMVFSSFKTSGEMYQNPLALPGALQTENYATLFDEQSMGRYFLNSATVTLFSVGCSLFFATLISFAILRLPGWKGLLVYGLFAVGMTVPAQVNMIPLYALVLDLGLTNSLLGLILVNIAVTLPVAVFIIAGFMKTLPRELIEAGAMDGASEWVMYRRIVLPLSLPSIAATAIFLFVMIWNDLLYPLLLTNNPDVKTLPLALLEFQGEYMTNYPVLFAGVLIASAPMILAYILLQRHFVSGMTAGAIKG